MRKVLICCGKICSGKTTFCKKIEKDHGVFVFNADEWMLHFFGESPDCTVFHEQLDKCISMIYSLAEKLLELNFDVAFYFGFWTIRDRQICLERFSKPGNDVKIVYFPIEDERQLENLNKRQSGTMNNTFIFTEEKLKTFNAKFQEP